MSEAVKSFKAIVSKQQMRNLRNFHTDHAWTMLMAIRLGYAQLDRKAETLTVGHEEFPIGLHTDDGSMLSQRCIKAIEAAVETASGESP